MLRDIVGAEGLRADDVSLDAFAVDALGQVLRDSRTGDYVAGLIARTPLPPVLLPFLVATFVRLVQGSGTVAMISVMMGDFGDRNKEGSCYNF